MPKSFSWSLTRGHAVGPFLYVLKSLEIITNKRNKMESFFFDIRNLKKSMFKERFKTSWKKKHWTNKVKTVCWCFFYSKVNKKLFDESKIKTVFYFLFVCLDAFNVIFSWIKGAVLTWLNFMKIGFNLFDLIEDIYFVSLKMGSENKCFPRSFSFSKAKKVC